MYSERWNIYQNDRQQRSDGRGKNIDIYIFNYLFIIYLLIYFLWSTCRILSCFSEQPFGKNLTETSLGTRIRIENRHNYIVILQVIQKVRSPSVQSRKSSRRPLVPPANWEEESEERLEILPAGRPSVQASGGQISVEVLTSLTAN